MKTRVNVLMLMAATLIMPIWCHRVFLNASMEDVVFSELSPANRVNISILATINYGGTKKPAGPVCSKAIELALDRLSNQPNWLVNYRLGVELIDDKCDDTTAISRVVDRVENPEYDQFLPIPFVMINYCASKGATTISELIKYYDYVGTVLNLNTGYSDKFPRFSNVFPFVERLGISYFNLFRFMKEQGWNRFALLSENVVFFNSVEQLFPKMVEELNMTMTGMVKLPSGQRKPEEEEQAILELRENKPRIFLVNRETSLTLWCWLYKYGMYGPNYVWLATTWSTVDPEKVSIPEVVSSWCTIDMLRSVTPSWLYFGGTLMQRPFGRNYKDSTGATQAQLVAGLQDKIVKPQTSRAWFVWPWQCYDQALFTGMMINATEDILQSKHNSTLVEWSTESDNFKKNPKVLANAFKEAASSVKVYGVRGVYQFSMENNLNLGFIPTVFVQPLLDVKSNKYKNSVIGYFKTNEGRTVLLNGGPVWRTFDKKPPRDFVDVISELTPPNSFVAYAITGTFAGGGIVLAIACLALVLGKLGRNIFTKEQRVEDSLILIGNVIMLGHVFALPLLPERSAVHISCWVTAALLEVGFSLTTSGMWMKLDHALSALLFEKLGRHELRKKAMKRYAIVSCWMLVNCCLVAVSLGFGDIVIAVSKHHLDPYTSADLNTIYEPYRFECFLESQHTAVGLTGGLACLHVAMLIAIAFASFKIHIRMKDQPYFNALKKRKKMKTYLTSATTCAYCQIVFIVSAVFVAATRLADAQFVGNVVAITGILLSYLDIVMIFFVKIIHQRKTNETTPK